MFGEKDRSRIAESSYCPLYKFIDCLDRSFFRSCSLSLSKAKVFFQLFTCNSTYQCLYLEGFPHRFLPSGPCPLCNTRESDTLTHFLLRCPVIKRCRPTRLSVPVDPVDDLACVARLVCVQSGAEMEDLWGFIISGLRLRRFIVDAMS